MSAVLVRGIRTELKLMEMLGQVAPSSRERLKTALARRGSCASPIELSSRLCLLERDRAQRISAIVGVRYDLLVQSRQSQLIAQVEAKVHQRPTVGDGLLVEEDTVALKENWPFAEILRFRLGCRLGGGCLSAWLASASEIGKRTSDRSDLRDGRNDRHRVHGRRT